MTWTWFEFTKPALLGSMVRVATWLAMITPWLRIPRLLTPIWPDPVMWLASLVKTSVGALPMMRLLVLFDIDRVPLPDSSTLPFTIRSVVLPDDRSEIVPLFEKLPPLIRLSEAELLMFTCPPAGLWSEPMALEPLTAVITPVVLLLSAPWMNGRRRSRPGVKSGRRCGCSRPRGS